jgi:hypothetical protein
MGLHDNKHEGPLSDRNYKVYFSEKGAATAHAALENGESETGRQKAGLLEAICTRAGVAAA